MKDRTKKWLVVAGGLALCAILAVLIGSKFITPPVTDPPLPITDDSTASVTVEAQPPASVKVDAQLPAGSDASMGAASTGTGQAVQPDVEKPEPPPPPVIDEEALTDPDTVPAYTPQQTAPPPAPAPSGGETRPGQIFVPGFGWIADEGGGAAGVDTGSEGDPNTQVGDM